MPIYGIIKGVGAIVQRIGHRPSKSTMLVRFQLALPDFCIKYLFTAVFTIFGENGQISF